MSCEEARYNSKLNKAERDSYMLNLAVMAYLFLILDNLKPYAVPLSCQNLALVNWLQSVC